MRERISAILFASIFALAFGAVGVFAIVNLTSTFSNWFTARDYQSVPARVLSAVLEESRGSKGTRVYRANVAFEYEIVGVRYVSDRLNLDDDVRFDNIGDYHRRIVDTLIAAKNQEAEIKVWVSPRKPGVAIYDRDIRWQGAALWIPFAIVFTMISLVASCFVWHLLRDREPPWSRAVPIQMN
jgi:hypothetical protein